MIPIAKRATAGRTLAGAVGNKIVDAATAEDVPAQLDHRVADVGVADGADGYFLLHSTHGQLKSSSEIFMDDGLLGTAGKG